MSITGKRSLTGCHFRSRRRRKIMCLGLKIFLTAVMVEVILLIVCGAMEIEDGPVYLAAAVMLSVILIALFFLVLYTIWTS